MNLNPSPETRFTPENQPAVHSKRGPSPLSVIKKFLDHEVDISNPLTHEMGKLKIEEVIALQWLAKAFKGDPEAIKDIIDRCDGKALQRMSNEGAPVQVYAPRTVNYIAVYNNDRPNGTTDTSVSTTNQGSGSLPGSIEPEGKV
jgi:hypothetical protein